MQEAKVTTVKLTLVNTTGYEFDCELDIYDSTGQVYDDHLEDAISEVSILLGKFHMDKHFQENRLDISEADHDGDMDSCEFVHHIMHYLKSGKLVKTVLGVTSYHIPPNHVDEMFTVKE